MSATTGCTATYPPGTPARILFVAAMTLAPIGGIARDMQSLGPFSLQQRIEEIQERKLDPREFRSCKKQERDTHFFCTLYSVVPSGDVFDSLLVSLRIKKREPITKPAFAGLRGEPVKRWDLLFDNSGRVSAVFATLEAESLEPLLQSFELEFGPPDRETGSVVHPTGATWNFESSALQAKLEQPGHEATVMLIFSSEKQLKE